MSVGYVPVQWNKNKKAYDLVMGGGVLVYLVGFFAAGKFFFRGTESISDEVLALRALGSCAFLMLTLILCIGPLARMDRRFLPVLYNRRHLGVATFAVAFLHGLLAVGYYHGFGILNPIVSLLTTNRNFTSLRAFPFQLLGLGALFVLLMMAVTSHDFWLKNLGQNLWKRLHMGVYFAYALVVGHVVLGPLQTQQGPLLFAAVMGAVVLVASLHWIAGRQERQKDLNGVRPQIEGMESWIDAGPISEFIEGQGRAVCVAGSERIAVFRHQGAVSALSNVCAHQGGPLGEGRIIDGCVTCPWHGWQYRPSDGQSPPPFQEKLPTHRVRVANGRVWVDPRPQPPGTALEPAQIMESTHG